MPNEKIEVEWIATATKMHQVLEKLEGKLDKQEKALKKIGDTSKKAADMAAGSFNKLEQELKDNEKALRGMAIGTKEFEKQKRKVDELRQSLVRAKSAMSTAGSAVGGALSRGIGQIGQMVAGVASLQMVVAGVVAELKKAQQIKINAAGTERTLEEALVSMAPNIGGENLGEARELIEANAPILKTTQAGLANLLSNAVSAGADDLETALQASAAALRVTGGNADAANGVLGGAMDVASLGGSDNFAGAIGQLLQSASQLRGTDLSQFSQNIGGGLAAATAAGQNQAALSTEQALEVAAVISQILKDQTGSVTSTALTNLVTRMDAFTPEESVKLEDGTISKLTKEQIQQFKESQTVDERVSLMRANPELARQFVETQEKGKGRTAISEIVQGSDRALEFERKARAAVTGIDEAETKFNELVAGVEGAAPVLGAERRSESNVEQFRTGGTQSYEGQAINVLNTTIAELDLPGVDMVQEKAIEYDLNVSQDKLATSIDILNKLLTDQAGGVGKRDLSGEEKELVRVQLEVLKELRDDRRRAMPQAQRPQAAPLPAVNVP